MSDHGYYPGSPSDDGDEYYYDDDIGENLADDLAEHTLPSPIFHDDPKFDTLEYHSDWEYYSDDYYDDDPVLLKDDPEIGSPAKRKDKTDKSQPRGKKRKLADTADIPPLALDDRPALAMTIRGTVWAGPKPPSPEPYEAGQGQTIALLKDWAQVFEKSSPRSILRRDESWANDLSLEDMGLRRVKSGLAQDGGAPVADEDDLGDEVEMDDGLGEDDIDGDVLDRIVGIVNVSEDRGKDIVDEDQEQKEKPNKRQRIVVPMPSPPLSHNGSSNTSTDSIVADMKNTSMNTVYENATIKASRDQSKNAVHTSLVHPQMIEKEKVEKRMKTCKRKASPDAEAAETTTTESVASRRAKRVASSRLGAKREEKSAQVPTTARATRSRKK